MFFILSVGDIGDIAELVKLMTNPRGPHHFLNCAWLADMSWHTECLTWMAQPGLREELEVKRQLNIWVPEYKPDLHSQQS